jgi:hypothetical protein
MKRLVLSVVISVLLLACLTPTGALADTRAHHAAIKICKLKYHDAVRGAKYLKKRQRIERIEQARRERAECERLAPR